MTDKKSNLLTFQVARQENGWLVFIEVLERAGVPDTQDILGRYDFSVDANVKISGYELSEHYRRNEL